MDPLKGYEPIDGHKRKSLHPASRVLPILALTTTTSISVLLLLNRIPQKIYTGRFYLWVHRHPIETSVAVNILAQILAFLQLFVLNSVINHSARA